MNSSTTVKSNSAIKSNSFNIGSFFSKYVLECILLVLILLLAIFQSGFLTPGNLLNILRNMSLQGVIAFGMTMVIISGEIDLSIGSTVALTGVIIAGLTGILAKQGVPMEYGAIIGIIVAFAISLIVGLFSGYLLTIIEMPSFIITLGLQILLYGVAAVLCNGFPITSLPRWYNQIGAGQIFGIIPVPAVVLLVVFAIVFVIMNYTKFGRSVYAVGGNKESARLSGVNVRYVKTAALVGVQLCSALAGVLVSSQVMSGNYTFGKTWEMTAISSCIIGGTSILGGIGKVWGTFIGLIFIGVILNGMTLLNINEFWQYIVRGGLILFAVLVNTLQTRRKG